MDEFKRIPRAERKAILDGAAEPNPRGGLAFFGALGDSYRNTLERASRGMSRAEADYRAVTLQIGKNPEAGSFERQVEFMRKSGWCVTMPTEERPDKNMETTKDFPDDFRHNRARQVIGDILDKSIKPGGLREIKRAITDREKDDAKGPPTDATHKALPGKALRLNAASWLTGR